MEQNEFFFIGEDKEVNLEQCNVLSGYENRSNGSLWVFFFSIGITFLLSTTCFMPKFQWNCQLTDAWKGVNTGTCTCLYKMHFCTYGICLHFSNVTQKSSRTVSIFAKCMHQMHFGDRTVIIWTLTPKMSVFLALKHTIHFGVYYKLLY